MRNHARVNDMARPRKEDVKHGTSTMYGSRKCRCEACANWARTYQRERRKRIRDAWFAEHGPCAQCGSWNRLELDHVDRAIKDPKLHKENGAGSVWTWSEGRRTKELSKCQALCYECHRAKSARERWPNGPAPLKHPSLYAYRMGCRCNPCVEHRRAYLRDWRRNRRV